MAEVNNFYNLLDEAWIPVVNLAGERKKVGLLQLFAEADQLGDLAVGPPQRIALTRLLLCIAQAALAGPKDPNEWFGCKAKIPHATQEYLEKHRDRFFLFGDKPFLQVAAGELKAMPKKSAKKTDEEKLTSTDKLDFGLASGNNNTVFDQDAREEGREHSPDWIALQILAFQSFSLGGTIAKMLWKQEETFGKRIGNGLGASDHAPCIEGAMLHTLVLGQNLLTTIHWNMIPFSAWTDGGKHSQQVGLPIWEKFPSGVSDKQAWDNATTSLLGRFVPMSRCLLVDGDLISLTLANACSYPKLPEYRDPAGSVKLIKTKKGEELKYIRTDPARHPWRSLGGILAETRNGVGGSLALANVRRAKALANNPDDFAYTLWVGGVLSDKAKILDACEWSFSILASLLDEQGLLIYQKGVEDSEKAETRIEFAVRDYCDKMKIDSKIITEKVAKAKTHFWTLLDQQHQELIDAASCVGADAMEQDNPLRAWIDIVVKKAKYSAYDTVCPHTTPRQIQAYAEGKRQLVGNKKTKNSKKTTRK